MRRGGVGNDKEEEGVGRRRCRGGAGEEEEEEP